MPNDTNELQGAEREEIDNLDFWNSVEETDPDYVQEVEYGARKFTSVDAYYRLKRATELWGPYGKTWGLKDIEYRFVNDLAVLKCVFHSPLGEFPISNAIRVEPDFAKKIETDTITKALSRLGMCADVYMGRFEDERYVTALRERRTLEEKKAILIYTMDKYRQEIEIIKAGIAENDLSSAAEVYVEIKMYDINNPDTKPLWIAPTVCKQKFGFDGPFTTHEREVIKSSEFTQHMKDFLEDAA